MTDKQWDEAIERGKKTTLLHQLAECSDAVDGAGLMFDGLTPQEEIALICKLLEKEAQP